MGEILQRLQPDELKACQLAADLIQKTEFQLGIVKRGYRNLWDELGKKYGILGKNVEIDYRSGLIIERENTSKEKNDG